MMRPRPIFGLLLCILMLALAAPIFGQEWSAEQKEAWAFELAYWKAWHAGDVETTVSYIHEDYQGWGYGEYLPSGKASTKRFFDHLFPGLETYVHEETPISIIVHGNVAVVHYIMSTHFKNAPESGEHAGRESRWTDTLVKEDGKWLLIGDHGGSAALIGN